MTHRVGWLRVTVMGLCLMSPSLAYASGGGPLLLLFSMPSFVVAFLIVMPVKWAILRRIVEKLPRRLAIGDVAVAGALSTAAIGILLPLLIAAIGFVGVLLPDPWGAGLLVLGTWVSDGSQHNKLALASALVWFMVLLGLIVLVEGWVLRRRWRRREQHSRRGPFAISALINLPSIIIAVATMFIMWRELF